MAGVICGVAPLAALLALALASAKSETRPHAQAMEVLQTVCLKCHNAGQKAGGIDLSTRATALASGAVSAGRPESGRLLRAVSEGRMPPVGRLPEAQIAAVRRWVLAGAPWPAGRLEPLEPARAPLWSFQPPRRPPLPRSRFDRLAVTPVDRFLFAGLEHQGLEPSAPAGKLALLRRVAIDLTGLPPTPQEVDAFLNDRSPDAYEKVVDRLLASPAYGERWARHWLDIVRFGESTGYEQNHLRRNAWPYRDYVIRALNQDKPYDRFILEQIAGDQLADLAPDSVAATGFLVAGVHDTVGIQEEEGTRQQCLNDLEDIVATTGAAFLGLTVGCARCHEHKFDPIPQEDFYRLAAVFAGVRHGERPLAPEPDEATRRELAENAAQQTRTQDAINLIDSQARLAAQRATGRPAAPRPAVTARRNSDEFAPLTARFVRLAILETLGGVEPALDEIQVFGADSRVNLAAASRGARASASGTLPGFAIHRVDHLNDGRFGNDWSWVADTRGAAWVQIELPRPERIDEVVWSRDGGEIPRFDDRLPLKYRIEVSLDGREWTTVSTEEGRAQGNDYLHPDRLREHMTPDQRARRDVLLAELRRLQDAAQEMQSRNMAYIGQFTSPDTTWLLRRGDVMQRGPVILPGSLTEVRCLPPVALPADAPEGARRLALARWIADPRNPLTARVIVNRLWQHHFGRGIVGTPSDFGRNGEKPTHPELLDWLACELMQPTTQSAGIARSPVPRPWSLKHIHRLIVTSYAYRQSSAASAAGMAKDAGNQLLWRMPLRRMEAEAVRDSILQASGRLDRRMGGPGFRLFRYKVVNVAIYEPLEEQGPETWRRAIYQQHARAYQDTLLGALDCPESANRTPRRDSTTTALQALSLLNGRFVRQQSNLFADRVRREAGASPTAQVRHAFRIAFGRLPRPLEEKAAVALAGSDGLPALCRALLNANEFLYF